MPKGRRFNSRGRSYGHGAYLQLHHHLLDTPAFRSLSGSAAKILLAICRRHNGVNNGELRFSVRDGEAWGLKPSRTAEVIHELIDAGFIKCTQLGSFHSKRLAALYELTWISPASGGPASRDFSKKNASAAERTHSAAGRTVGGANTERMIG